MPDCTARLPDPRGLLIGLLLGCQTAGTEPPTPPPASPTRELARRLDERRGHHQLPGLAAVVMRHGEVLASFAVGERETGSGTRLQPGDCFDLASCAKPITATVIAQLVADGRLDYDLPLPLALPGVPLHPSLRPVTLRQLLGHRAGLPACDDLGAELVQRWAGQDLFAARRGFVEEILAAEPVRRPGTFHYSNAGYVVAALAAEASAGKPFSRLVEELLHRRLGLERLWLGPSPHCQPRVRGHYHRDQPADGPGVPELFAPAAGACGSLEDLARFGAYHVEILRRQPDASLAELHRPAAPDGRGYGMGFGLRRREGVHVSWHNGATPSAFAQLTLEPASGLVIAVACNGGTGREACDQVTELLREEFTR